MANLRGLTRKTGVNMRPMHTANNAKAASRRPPKTSNRSQRLTVNIGQRRSVILARKLAMHCCMKHFCAGTPFLSHRPSCAAGAVGGRADDRFLFRSTKASPTIHAIWNNAIQRNGTRWGDVVKLAVRKRHAVWSHGPVTTHRGTSGYKIEKRSRSAQDEGRVAQTVRDAQRSTHAALPQ
jgi:hypothetical protein